MKNSLIFAFALAAAPQAYALDVSFPDPLNGAAATVNGQVLRLPTGNDDWADRVFFTMGVDGSFSARVQTVYVDPDPSSVTTDPRLSFFGIPGAFRLFDVTTSEARGTFQPETPSSRNYDFTFSFANLVKDHDYRLDVSGSVFGTGGSASYTLTYPSPPVPEPSTYALLVLGLGAVGLMRRHRMRRDA